MMPDPQTDAQRADLIARLEAASEGTAALDVYVHLALYGKARHGEVPDYTTSLDAALTLIPHTSPPARIRIERMFSSEKIAHLSHHRAKIITGYLETIREFTGEASTFPLSLCISALKAKDNT
jgi:hypothetical protein